jgi:hypothetical protein
MEPDPFAFRFEPAPDIFWGDVPVPCGQVEVTEVVEAANYVAASETSVSRCFTVRGHDMALAMLRGIKRVEWAGGRWVGTTCTWGRRKLRQSAPPNCA